LCGNSLAEIEGWGVEGPEYPEAAIS
jgi:hypothetical protein